MMYYDPGHIFLILSILGAILTLGVGVFVLIRNPRHPSNIGFAIGMLSLSVIEGGNAFVFFSEDLIWSLYGKRISIIGQTILVPGWFLFSLTFIRSNYKELLARWKFVLAGLSLAAGFFLLWIDSYSFVGFPFAEAYIKYPLGTLGKYFYIYMLIGILLCLVQLENTLRFSMDARRRGAKYVVIGVASVLAYYIYLSSQAILFSILDSSNQSVTSIVILISCAITTFAVVSSKLLEVNIFISRYVIYNSFTLLFAGAYLLIVGVVAQGLKMTGGTYDTFWSVLFIFTAVLGLAVAFLSTNLRRRLQLFIIKHFYRHKYEFRDKWMETIERIGLNNDLSTLQESLIEMISETMGVREVFLWQYEPSCREYLLAKSSMNHGSNIRLREDHPLILTIKGSSDPFYINENNDSDESDNIITPFIIAASDTLCTPLIAGQGDLIGFILQGEDISGEPYNKDDFDLLKAIASHAAERIHNISLTQELLASKEVEAFHQVSTFFIHDLKNFVSTLSLLSQNAEEHIGNPLFQQDVLKTLKQIVSRMNGLVSNLTVLSKGIQVNPERTNINEVVEDTLSTLNGNVSGKVIKRLDETPMINADSGQLQKVLLNLLLNAIEASLEDKGEKKIEIKTFTRNGDVVLSVSDHGCGMSQEFIKTSLFKPFKSSKSNGLGIGLFQCKKIIEAHSGSLEVESEIGKGSEFRVILPK